MVILAFFIAERPQGLGYSVRMSMCVHVVVCVCMWLCVCACGCVCVHVYEQFISVKWESKFLEDIGRSRVGRDEWEARVEESVM